MNTFKTGTFSIGEPFCRQQLGVFIKLRNTGVTYCF